MLYKARILQKSTGFSGELMRGRVIEYQLDGYATDGKAAYALNQKIKEYNQKYNLAIPSVSAENHFISYQTDEPEDEIVITPSRPLKVEAVSTKPSAVIQDNMPTQTVDNPLPEKASANPIQDIAKSHFKKSTKPKRKPFTPYGLNGYLVDKQGNVRLILDRRANAHTIVLEPEMFSALAEMVKKTQEQKNANA